jgi:hypothetical protein
MELAYGLFTVTFNQAFSEWSSCWDLGSTCGLYYKPMMIVNDDSRVINKLETSLADNARVVTYDHHMFIVQATGYI